MMNPTIIRHHEIGTKAYFLIQLIGRGQVDNRIQIYTPADDGHMMYERGQSWSEFDKALDEYNQIIKEAEQKLMQEQDDIDDAELWSKLHPGR